MAVVKQKAEIIEKSDNKINNIANIARVCYKSENNADDESDLRLVKNLIKNKHFAMLEHEDYAFVFADEEDLVEWIGEIEASFGVKLYLLISKSNHIISGNIRAWRNFLNYSFLWLSKNRINGVCNDIFYNFSNNVFFLDIFKKYDFQNHKADNAIVEISNAEFKYKEDFLTHYRVSAKIICDRGISHELVRHRAFSFAQESTRYINYGKKEIDFIDYSDYVNDDNMFFETVLGNNIYSERRYVRLIDNGNSPQMARVVLPHNFKTEMVMTGNIRAWLHFFNLRLFEKTGKAHPMIKDLAEQLYDEFENKTPISKKLIDSWSDELWENENE